MNFCTYNNCPLCSSENIARVYTTYDRHYGIAGEYNIDRCEECDLHFLNPVPSPEHLLALYPKTYYSYQEFAKPTSFLKQSLKKLLINVGTKDPVFEKPGRILDIGCGSGTFLHRMQKKGWQVSGVEINEDAAKVGKKYGLDIHGGDLMSAGFADASFNYVRLNHSFEHIHNPRKVLEEIYRILKNDGKLMIGVPNIDSLNARLFKKYWWYLGVPVHTFNYSVKTLTLLLQQQNFATEKVIYNSDYGGNLGSLQIYLNRRNGRKSEQGALIRNPLLRIIAFNIAKITDFFHQGDAIEITAVKAR